MRIRKANPDDAAALYALKQQLPMPAASHTTNGGFILGTDEKTYREYIQIAYCLIAENDDGVKGFGIVFPDNVIRLSHIWQKRFEAEWVVDIRQFEEKNLCYFEQLAFLPGNSKWASLLSYLLLKMAFDDGCDYMIATVVRKPVHNKAAIPFLEAIGGNYIGNINETYPQGPINSDIYGVDRQDFYIRTKEHKLYSYVMRSLPIVNL